LSQFFHTQESPIAAHVSGRDDAPLEMAVSRAKRRVALNERVNRFYCPELDGLRFLAFFLVFLHHAPLYGHGNPTLLAKLEPHGWMGVDLFLCLSSFLISKLLLLEWRSKGRISLTHFYVRRSLRIWPLYFFMCFLGFVVLPYVGLGGPSIGGDAYRRMVHDYLLPYLTFLGNYATANHDYAPSNTLLILWTISLEEQFYILWPLVLLALSFKRTSLLKLSCFLLAGTVMFRAAAVWWGWKHPALYVSLWTRLDPFVLGALLAFYQEELDRWMKNVPPGVLALAGLASMWLVTLFPSIEASSHHAVWQLFCSALGPCLLIAAVTKPGHLRTISSSYPLVQLGRISYGLYVYHFIALGIARRLLVAGWNAPPHADCGLGIWAIEFALGLGLTVLMAWLSYHLYEKQFLRLKKRFSSIESRPI
jgi:peptidoglycan/LPS O-acetylase OafA/YrhL